MRRAFLCLALGLCASTLGAQYARARVWPPGYPTQIALDTLGSATMMAAPAEKVFRAAVAAFDELKIQLDTRDSLGGMVGNMNFQRTHSLAGSQMSRWFNCGQGITGPNADSWRLFIAVAVLLDKVSTDTTRVRIGLAAGARDMQGNSKEPVPCASSGSLEARLLELTKVRAGAR